MILRRTELKFQNHIIDSYQNCGGRARKWASEWQKGMPDLICSLPGVGGHLLEVKHEPEFGGIRKVIKNPLAPKQRNEAEKYIAAGCPVFAAIVCCGVLATGTKLALFHPMSDVFYFFEDQSVPYVAGHGYDMRMLIENKLRR